MSGTLSVLAAISKKDSAKKIRSGASESAVLSTLLLFAF